MRLTDGPFLDKVDVELKRAERYRIFISLAILDFGFLEQTAESGNTTLIDELTSFVEQKIRAIDDVSVVEGRKVAFLFPETTRQEAEIASKRLRDLLHEKLSELTSSVSDVTIPFEMVSYPDAAGAKSVRQFLTEMADKNSN